MDSTNKNRKDYLRIGLLVDTFVQPRWVYEIVRDIQSSAIARIVLVIRNSARPTEKRFRLHRYWENRKHLLYAAYTRFDDFKTRAEPDAFEASDIEPLVTDCPIISVEPLMTKYVDRFEEGDVQKILEYQLDVALRFAFRILKGDVLKIAQHGVWSYHHGDGSVNRGGPAGFWEVMEGTPVTGSMLQVLTEELDNGQILYKSWSPTSDRFSVKMNRNNLYWKSSTFVMRKLKELHEFGQASFLKNSLYHPYSNRLYGVPANDEMLALMSRLTAGYLASKARQLSSFNQWSLAYKFKSHPADQNDAFYKFKYLIPPKDRFWADPFPVKAADKYFIFIEEFLYGREKGHISLIEIEKDRTFKPPIKVLEKGYHLSYPFVFKWGGEHYMIPETAANNSVELYRCISFPERWELDKVIMENVNATDSTLIEADGFWWMFVNIGDRSYPSDWDELYIFYSDNPKGEWRSHKQNPVKKDVRSSRPAGRLFYWNGELYRPAQDSSTHYGYGVSINKITRLSPDEFFEEEISKVLPRWNKRIIGTHTLNSAGDLTVIDCLMKRTRFF